MPHRFCRPLVLLLILPSLARPAAPPRPAPLYSLPEEGTWVEYDWKATEPDRPERVGTLRISFVGQKNVEGVPYCWIEMLRATRDGGSADRQVRKLLVARTAFREGDSVVDRVAEGFHQGAADGPVTRLSAARLRRFVTLGIGGPDVAFRVVRDGETTDSGLGQFRARHVSAGSRSEGRPLEYHGWLSDEVPFGWVRFEIREKPAGGPERVVFTARAVKQGRGARSELDESRARRSPASTHPVPAPPAPRLRQRARSW
jgi:hypothetical protein